MTYEARAYLTEENWAALRERATRSRHGRNELIFESGARHRSLHLVVDGIVRVRFQLSSILRTRCIVLAYDETRA